MPVLIDTIDTEIEFAPRQAGAGDARPAAPAAPATTSATAAISADALRKSLLAVLESELDQYMRMRG